MESPTPGNNRSNKRPMFHLRRQHRRPPSPKKLKRTVTPPEEGDEEGCGGDDCHHHDHHHDHHHNADKQRRTDSPPNLMFSFDSTSSLSDGDENDVAFVPHSILKRSNKTSSCSSSSPDKKQVHWRPRLVTHDSLVNDSDSNSSNCHHRHKQQQQQHVLSFATTTDDDSDDTSERWLTNDDLAQLKASEKSLYRQELPLQHTTATTSQDWEDCPTAKMYLAECRGVYEWMQSELLLQSSSQRQRQQQQEHPTSLSATTATTKSLGSNHKNEDDDDDDSPNHQHHQQQQQQQHHHHHHEQDWSHDDFLHLVLHNNPVLWNGWNYFRGMESGRMPWRKTRTRAVIHTILRLQHFHSEHELATAASRLTAVDAMWAHFAAVGDEQQQLMEECLDVLRQRDFANETKTSDNDDDENDVSSEHQEATQDESSSMISPAPSLVPIEVSSTVSNSGGSN